MSNWSEVADVADVPGNVFGLASAKFLELGAVSTGDQVLDVACGSGGFSRLALAKVAGKGGRVVGVDQCDAMVKAAEAKSAGMEGAQFATGDASAIGAWGEIFDAAFCRFGLPYFADSAAVIKAAHDSLKPGGRICLMGVGSAANNDFFSLLGPVAGGENLQRTLEAGKVVSVAHRLEEAGFVQVATKEIRALVTVDDPNTYWTVLRGMLGIPNQPIPADLAQRVAPGTKLGVSLYFARGIKRDPNAAAVYVPKNFEQFVGLVKRSIREINPMGIKEEFRREKVVFLDVRDPNSVTSSIRDSVAITRDKLETEAPQRIPAYDTNIVTYCVTGDEGVLAASQLEKMGYSKVWNLQGGMNAWEYNKMPTA